MPRSLRIEDQALLICAHQDFNQEHIRAVQTICRKNPDWYRLLHTAIDNHIGPLVFVNLQKAHIELPPIVALDFKKHYIDNILRKKEAQSLLAEALETISEWQKKFRVEVRLMLVKGAAYNVLIYSEPWYTYSADIDLFFNLPLSSLPENARQHLIDHLEMLNAKESRFRTHLEYDFVIHHDININGLIPIDHERIWRESRPLQLNGNKLYLMSPEDNLIAAAIACCRRRYFYLKPLLDLSECTRLLKNLDWNKVINIANSEKASGILFTGLWMVKNYLDAPVPSWVFPQLDVPSVQRMMIQSTIRFLLGHFSFAHLTQVWDTDTHPVTAALPLMYMTYQPDQLIRRIGRSLESIHHD